MQINRYNCISQLYGNVSTQLIKTKIQDTHLAHITTDYKSAKHHKMTQVEKLKNCKSMQYINYNILLKRHTPKSQ